jgi:hypothetical protein
MYLFYICLLVLQAQISFSLYDEETDLSSLSANYQEVEPFDENFENWSAQNDAGVVIFESVSRSLLKKICEKSNTLVYITQEDVTVDCKAFNNDNRPIDQRSKIVKREAEVEVEGSGDGGNGNTDQDQVDGAADVATATPQTPRETTPEEIVKAEEVVTTEVPRVTTEDPEAAPEAPQTVPETPESVPEAPESVSETPESVPEAPQSVPETPETVPETSESATETSESETKNEVQEEPSEVPDATSEPSENPSEVPESKSEVTETAPVIPQNPAEPEPKPDTVESPNDNVEPTDEQVHQELDEPDLGKEPESKPDGGDKDSNSQNFSPHDSDAEIVQGKTLINTKTNEEVKEGENDDDSVKAHTSTEDVKSSGSSKDTTILVVLFVAVIIVGAAAFAYNFIKKRRQQSADLERVERGSIKRSFQNLAKADNEPEKKPLIGEKKDVEMVDMKKESRAPDDQNVENVENTTSDTSVKIS